MFKFATFGILVGIAAGGVAFASGHMNVCAPAKVHQARFQPVLTEYADKMPTLVCWQGRCNVDGPLLADNSINGIPTPLPPPPIQIAPQMFDNAPPVVTVAPPKEAVMLGDYANAALEWLLPILAPVVAGFIVDALLKLRQMLGQKTSDAQRDRLQKMAENAVNLAAHEAGHDLAGKIPVQLNSQVMARAVDYVQAHGTDTLKALGLDPTDPKAVEAIKGRVATILANKQAEPAVPVTAAAPGIPRATAT